MTILELGVSYRFETLINDDPAKPRNLTFEPIFGLRYVGMKGDLDIAFGPLPGPNVSGSQNWFEPFIGFRSVWKISEMFTAGARADIGGFSIGSRLTWSLAIGLDYRISELISANLGYEWMDIDYSTGSGRNRFAIDALIQGFRIGVSFHF